MVILEEISQGIADFSIPHVDAIGIKSQSCKMINIIVYGVFMRNV